jgi:hypothetical protein
MSSPPPTKPQLAQRLQTHAADLEQTAVDLDYYGGLAPWALHAQELLGAAALLRDWSAEIQATD